MTYRAIQPAVTICYIMVPWGFRGKPMRTANSATFAFALLMLAGGLANAQTIQFTAREIALKNGESTEVGDVYFIGTNCKSLLKATPEVEIMEGPPGVTVVINAAKVVPHGYGCANPVTGGKLV